MASTNKPKFSVIDNRRARFEFEFIDTFEAGILLRGTEVKALRAGEANLSDAYCYFKNGELWIRSFFIKEYSHGTDANHDPKRERKLLLKARELKRLAKKIKEKGFTIVPFKVYMNERSFVKVSIALARGKKIHDKRNSIRNKDQKRSLDRIMKGR